MGIRFFVFVVLLGLTLSTLDAKSLKGKRIFSKNIYGCVLVSVDIIESFHKSLKYLLSSSESKEFFKYTSPCAKCAI